jgi:NADH-quinone oxidoreductase subunit E
MLSKKAQEHIDHWLAKYPPDQRQSAVIPALHIVQDENNGFLTEALMNEVADYLGMPRIAVYEVATFYSLFNLSPVGRHIIHVCTNLSCMLCDCQSIVGHLKKRLDIDFGQTTADGKFTLKKAECLAACTMAPVMEINGIYYEKLTEEKVDQILGSLE